MTRLSHTIRVYTASKLEQSERWKQLRVDWPEIHFTARWPYMVGQLEDSPSNARLFWLDDEADITSADVVLIFAEKHEHLRGALVEAGMAIALGKRVIVVGEHTDYGTWQYHPAVIRVKTLTHAKAILGGLQAGLYHD